MGTNFGSDDCLLAECLIVQHLVKHGTNVLY